MIVITIINSSRVKPSLRFFWRVFIRASKKRPASLALFTSEPITYRRRSCYGRNPYHC